MPCKRTTPPSPLSPVSFILTICANMPGNIRTQSESRGDDDVMDSAGGNEWFDSDEDFDSPEDSSSFTAGQVPADTSQGCYTKAII